MITDKSSNRVIRGGSWNNTATNCRVANRNNNDPANRNDNNGFRVVLSQLKRRGGCPLLNRLLFLVLSKIEANFKLQQGVSKNILESPLLF